jgi:hypothetical protein
MLAGPFAKKHELVENLPKKLFFRGGYGIGGESKAWIGRLDRLDLAGLQFDEPLSAFSLDKAGAGANPDRAGILGGRVLSHCRVFFDYSRECMILEPYKEFAPVIPRNLSGLMLTTGGRGHWHDLTVTRVIPGSPAADAGFAEGDRLVTVDGRAIREFTQHSLGVYFGEPGKKVRVTVERGGETKQLELALRRLL